MHGASTPVRATGDLAGKSGYHGAQFSALREIVPVRAMSAPQAIVRPQHGTNTGGHPLPA